MKISTLVILSDIAVEGSSRASKLASLDPSYNRMRPKFHPKGPAAYPDLASLFPNQIRHDPALFQMVDKKLFVDPRGRRRFHPLDKKRRAIEDEFFCTQDSMFLIHKTSDYEAFSTLDFTDFAMNSADCNVDNGYFAWFAVDTAFDGHNNQTDPWINGGVPNADEHNVIGTDGQLDPVDDGPVTGINANGETILVAETTIEYIAAIFPLDGCGTTAEMHTEQNNAGLDKNFVLFKNRIRNGKFSSVQSSSGPNAGLHNGIVMDAAVDFSVECKYRAEYKEVGMQIDAKQSALADQVENDSNVALTISVDFLNKVTRGGMDFASTLDPMSVDGDDFVVAGPGHSVKVGETAYAKIKLDKPNDLIKIQVDACRLTHTGGLGERLAYDFIGGDSNKNNCPDPYTSAKLIQAPNGDPNEAFISFTMFEFVDEDLNNMAVQNNELECDITICLRDQPCPNSCDSETDAVTGN